MTNEFKKFTSIEKFSDVWYKALRFDIGEVLMRSKIKLHGTNAGIRIVDGQVTARNEPRIWLLVLIMLDLLFGHLTLIGRQTRT